MKWIEDMVSKVVVIGDRVLVIDMRIEFLLPVKGVQVC